MEGLVAGTRFQLYLEAALHSKSASFLSNTAQNSFTNQNSFAYKLFRGAA